MQSQYYQDTPDYTVRYIIPPRRITAARNPQTNT